MVAGNIPGASRGPACDLAQRQLDERELGAKPSWRRFQERLASGRRITRFAGLPGLMGTSRSLMALGWAVLPSVSLCLLSLATRLDVPLDCLAPRLLKLALGCVLDGTGSDRSTAACVLRRDASRSRFLGERGDPR